jgi:tetratricopeptide (TPR) repeat protein
MVSLPMRTIPFHCVCLVLSTLLTLPFAAAAQTNGGCCEDETVRDATLADLATLYATQHRASDLAALAERAQRSCAARNVPLIGSLRLRAAMEAYHHAEHAAAPDATGSYEHAAGLLERAASFAPRNPDAPLALYYAALAFERAERSPSAARTYERILRDYDDTHDTTAPTLHGDALAERATILDAARFRAAVSNERSTDYEAALAYYRQVIGDPRAATVEGHGERLHDALASVAIILTHLGRWNEARTAWNHFAPAATNADERAEAEFRAAEMPFRGADYAEARRALGQYLRDVPTTPERADWRVEAQYHLALAAQHQGDERGYRTALREVTALFRTTAAAPGTRAAHRAAEALYRDLDDSARAFSQRVFQSGDAASLRGQIERAREQLRVLEASAREVIALRSVEDTIATLVTVASAHEHLATQEARVGECLALSATQQRTIAVITQRANDLRRVAARIERTSPSTAERTRERAEELTQNASDAIGQRRTEAQSAFDREAEAERSLAIIGYATAVHLARSQNIPSPIAARGMERLRAEENRALLNTALAHQNAFTYRPGMFDSEAPGAVLTETAPFAAPTLAAYQQ